MKLRLTKPLFPIICLGVLLGLGGFTFVYGEGFSYFSTNPKACVNCHVMNDEYDSWGKSSHHAAAGCVDCHMPHDSLVSKLVAKTDNGIRHSKGFTFMDFKEPIMITPRNAEILQESCIHCHADLVHGINIDNKQVRCVHCHAYVGHGSLRETIR
jgi:cytochrome c nitrite reductase small subunit